MKNLILLSSLLVAASVTAQANQELYVEAVKCGSDGCSIVCRESGARWDTFLQSKGNLEITYFFASGTRQIKANMGAGQYTILDTNPNFQTCRISGVVK
ncbi:MAG: hypothetical protein L3J53_04065 [Proteobacteria bacterium]|nr:hypothetical protein [Pseudomonadota bacterium]